MDNIEQQLKALIPQTRSAMIWLDDPKRTKEEVDKWYPRYKVMFDIATQLERTIRCGNE